jgi:hypothetical protein
MPRGQALGITFQLPEQDKGESEPGRTQTRAEVADTRLVHAPGVHCHDRRRARWPSSRGDDLR